MKAEENSPKHLTFLKAVMRTLELGQDEIG